MTGTREIAIAIVGAALLRGWVSAWTARYEARQEYTLRCLGHEWPRTFAMARLHGNSIEKAEELEQACQTWATGQVCPQSGYDARPEKKPEETQHCHEDSACDDLLGRSEAGEEIIQQRRPALSCSASEPQSKKAPADPNPMRGVHAKRDSLSQLSSTEPIRCRRALTTRLSNPLFDRAFSG